MNSHSAIKKTLSTEQIDTLTMLKLSFIHQKVPLRTLECKKCGRKLTCNTKTHIELVSKMLKNKSETN